MLVVFTFSHFSVNRSCRVIWYIMLIANIRFNFHYTIPMLLCRIVNIPNDLFSSKSASRVITSFPYLFQFASCKISYIIIVCIDHIITTVKFAITKFYSKYLPLFSILMFMQIKNNYLISLSVDYRNR